MKILGVELLEVRMPLRDPFETSVGTCTERRIILVRVEGDEGGEGWGECVAWELPCYSSETVDTAWAILQELILPAVVGREILDPREILKPVQWIRGHSMAKAAFEMAAWDLQAKEQGVSLRELLGGSDEPLSVGVSVGLQRDLDTLMRRIEEHLKEGYARIKLKIKRGQDVELLRAVRDRFPELTLQADANAAYTLDDAELLQELDDFDLVLLEQPLGEQELLDHAELQAGLRTPICLDESIRSAADARLALELGACRIVNIKPGRVGGLSESRAIHDLCQERGVPVWCGGMLESGIGRAHNLALATLPGFTLPGDLSESRRYWERDVVHPEFELMDGKMVPPEGLGIGVEPDRDRIRQLTLRRFSVGTATPS